MQENKSSSLHKHLMGGDISALETALKLEATVGFPYSDYEYYSYDWDSEEDYNNFIYFGEKIVPSAVISIINFKKQVMTLLSFIQW